MEKEFKSLSEERKKLRKLLNQLSKEEILEQVELQDKEVVKILLEETRGVNWVRDKIIRIFGKNLT